jgi:hypothetical protein
MWQSAARPFIAPSALGNLKAALAEAPRPGAERKLSSRHQALLVATACSKPPAGRARWTLELLAGEMVKLTDHQDLSRETDMWYIPQVDGAYVARIEDVLDLYAEEPDPHRPVICFDESPTQLIGETRQPIPPDPGKPERCDCEYSRKGTANLFVGRVVVPSGGVAEAEQAAREARSP